MGATDTGKVARCIHCQRDNPPEAKFCQECGVRLASRCVQCSTELPTGAKFCTECGHPVGARSAVPPRPSTPRAYTSKHLTEGNLQSPQHRTSLEGSQVFRPVYVCAGP